MLLFGHMGIGSRMISPWAKGLPILWVMLGTLLPDLIDKPLYYIPFFLTGKKGADLGLISGSRTLGHTGVAVLLILVIAMISRRRQGFALALGMATHLVLDSISDLFLVAPGGTSSAWMALVFPFFGFHFAVIPFDEIAEHAAATLKPFTLVCEAAGFLILCQEFWRRKMVSRKLRHRE